MGYEVEHGVPMPRLRRAHPLQDELPPDSPDLDTQVDPGSQDIGPERRNSNDNVYGYVEPMAYNTEVARATGGSSTGQSRHDRVQMRDNLVLWLWRGFCGWEG
jgi:hypothetical protein